MADDDDIFAVGIAALFDNPILGVDATYTPPEGGTPIPCRAQFMPSEQAVGGGATRQLAGAFRIDLRLAELAPVVPRQGGVVTIDGRAFRLRQVVRDELGITVECGCDGI